MPPHPIQATQGMNSGLLWAALLHGAWLGLAAAGLVALLFQTRRRLSHRARHTILLGAIGLVAVGSPALAVIQSRVAWHAVRSSPISVADSAAVSPELAGAHAPAATSAPATPSPEESSPLAPLGRFLSLALDRTCEVMLAARSAALAVWSLTVLSMAAVLALGAKGLNRIRREAYPAPSSVRKRAERLGRLTRLRTLPAIRVHETLDEPCLCGVFRPVVLLPARWLATARPEAIDAVLAHELAHAKRFDHLVNLAQRLLEVLLFFHPGVHWLSRSLRRQCEHCADALAVRLTGDPLALARALESVARFRANPSIPRPLGAAFGGESTSLLPRIQELIGMTPIRPRAQVWPFAALPSAAAVALVAASIGFADDRPTPSSSKIVTAVPPTSPPATTPTEDVPEITYEVRFLDFAPQPWLGRFEDRLKPCGPNTESREWIIDDKTLADLVKHLAGDTSSNLLQFPKVTAFENAGAIFLFGPDTSRAPNPVEAERESSEKFKLGTLSIGQSRLQVKGSFSPGGTRLSIDLLAPTPVAKRIDRVGGEKAETARNQPAPGAFHYEGSCEVPTGSNLLINMGRHERQVGSKTLTSERIVLITPRRASLELKPHTEAKTALPTPR
jgi:beta-lactamase regulating signal transducer with metallopeptidase domain